MNALLRTLWLFAAMLIVTLATVRARAADGGCSREPVYSALEQSYLSSVSQVASEDEAAAHVEDVAGECDNRGATVRSKEPALVRGDNSAITGELPECVQDGPPLDIHPAFESVQIARFPSVFAAPSQRLGFEPSHHAKTPEGVALSLERPPRF